MEATTLRNVHLVTLVQTLQEQQDARRDYVAPASTITAVDGILALDNGTLVAPSDIMVGGMADRLDVPVRFLRDITARASNLDLPYVEAFDAVMNARLATAAGQDRSFLVRTFTDTMPGVPAYGRALLSDRYRIVDNYDVLLTALQGIQASGLDCNVVECDLTERRMRVRVEAPAIRYVAEEFLKGYRNPLPTHHTGYEAGTEPIIFAGIELSNSETGGGRLKVEPRMIFQICKNGLRITKDTIGAVHLGARMETGEVDWADDTRDAIREAITLQVRDAIARFLTVDYLEEVITDLQEAGAGTPLARPSATIEEVGKRQGWTAAEAESVFGCFIAGGQATAGGVMQAMTAAAQQVTDPERAAWLEEQAVPAMSLAAQLTTV